MLKIAEYNTKTGKKIDLKELENFGFYKCNYVNTTVYKKKIIVGKESNNYIIDEDRTIHYNQMSVINTLDNTLFDLQEAGYVIKESE